MLQFDPAHYLRPLRPRDVCRLPLTSIRISG